MTFSKVFIAALISVVAATSRCRLVALEYTPGNAMTDYAALATGASDVLFIYTDSLRDFRDKTLKSVKPRRTAVVRPFRADAIGWVQNERGMASLPIPVTPEGGSWDELQVAAEEAMTAIETYVIGHPYTTVIWPADMTWTLQTSHENAHVTHIQVLVRARMQALFHEDMSIYPGIKVPTVLKDRDFNYLISRPPTSRAPAAAAETVQGSSGYRSGWTLGPGPGSSCHCPYTCDCLYYPPGI